MSAFQLPIAANNDILSWTNQDPRESILFNAWGVVYRFTVSSVYEWIPSVDTNSVIPRLPPHLMVNL